jgi:hypothetical protein
MRLRISEVTDISLLEVTYREGRSVLDHTYICELARRRHVEFVPRAGWRERVRSSGFRVAEKLIRRTGQSRSWLIGLIPAASISPVDDREAVPAVSEQV